MLFDDKVPDRDKAILFHMSKTEREFLSEKAKANGISVVTLIRRCLKGGLFKRKRRR